MKGLIDSHCHLTHRRFDHDRAEVIARLRDAGLAKAICIGTGVPDACEALAIAATAPDLIAVAAGLDPFTCHELGTGFTSGLGELAALLREGDCVALGEVGLEYFHKLGSKEEQRQQLEAQLDLAQELDLPVVIHCRDAHQDMLAVLASRPELRGVIHSFTGGPREAEAYLALGWYLSFNGIVTFPKAPELRAAVPLVPTDRLLVETDAPFLAPVPHRGRRCEPPMVADTLALLAELRDEQVEDLGRTTSANARRLFGLADGAEAGLPQSRSRQDSG